MPLEPLPPDPEPNEADLAPHWEGNPGIEDKIRRVWAKMKWRTARKKGNGDAFLVMFDPEKHNAYMETQLWHDIKQRVLQNAAWECVGCDQPATEVHHRDYRPRVLAGLDDVPLVALCKACQSQVYHVGRGQIWTEEERVLAELVTRKEARRSRDPE